MKNTTRIGNRAEQAVSEELSRQGYKIIELNWKTAYAEIDIVARKDTTMYFVEVKYRGSTQAGDGFDYITPRKLQHMSRAAELWVQQHDYPGSYQLLAAAVLGRSDGYLLDIRELA